MAAIGLVAAGLGGRADYGGETAVRAGSDASRRDRAARAAAQGRARADLGERRLGGAGALVAARAREAAAAADLVAAASMEAAAGTLDRRPGGRRGQAVPGQAQSAARIRAFLAGSDAVVPGRGVGPGSAVVPGRAAGPWRVSRVHAPLAEAIEPELASSDDNPLVSVAEGRLISNGNFHPMVLALAADAPRPAIAHVGLSDRR